MILEADWTWTGERFQPGVRVAVDAAGTITEVGASAATTERLKGRALVPGLVNVHSHAFQRGLRGHGERFPGGHGDFWSWRQAMYGLVERIDAAELYTLSHRAFREMLAAGITTVGEFHYLHHAESGDYALDQVVLRAAADAGIRIVLVSTVYMRGGFEQPLAAAQRRFATPDLATYFARLDSLALGANQHLGTAAHSLRAVPLEVVVELHREAHRRGLVMHAHIEEQPRELEECRREHGTTPLALLVRALDSCEGVTAVHCTYSEPLQLERFRAAGGTVCVCPLTEANLGDGIAPPAALAGASLGTDSNARIAMTEEMRWLEYAQRLQGRRRGCLVDARGEVGARLLQAATVDGARALGLAAGAIAPGHHADFVEIALDTPALAGWTPDTLLASWILGTGDQSIAGAWVGGRRV